jgi:general secretion pathway protein K
MKRGDRRGVALVFVLWLLVLLGAIMAAVASQTRSEAAILTSLRARTVARYSAESGILAATVRIEALLDSTPSMPDRVTALHELAARLAPLTEVALGGGRFGIGVVDINARLDLNRADAATLQGLFEQFIPARRAEEVVASLKQAPFHRLGELSQIPGIDDSLAAAVAPYVTVWGDGSVNINSAPEPVLAALPGVSPAMARSAVQRRETGVLFMSSDPLRPSAAMPTGPVRSGGNPGRVASPAAPLLTVIPSRLLIVSRGWQEGHPLNHEIQAVYSVLGARLVLLAWQERDL